MMKTTSFVVKALEISQVSCALIVLFKINEVSLA